MSGTWSGFSEDDILKLKSGDGSLEVAEKSRRVIRAKRRTDQNNAKSKTSQQHTTADVTYPVPEDAKLSKKDETLQTSEVLNQPVASHPVLNGTSEKTNSEVNLANISTSDISNNEKKLIVSKSQKKPIDLDEFQARQKLIEEQNRKRKELLGKALADRTKQTEEEARRLREIQNEFKKLDALLSNDVSILRHQIELASLDFMEAQKKYNKVEKEFLDAKINLHQRLEKKEMLTEHLCAIIEKNEERKAEKLNELMNRLTVGGKTVMETYENGNSESSDMEIKNSSVKEEVLEEKLHEESSVNICNSISQ